MDSYASRKESTLKNLALIVVREWRLVLIAVSICLLLSLVVLRGLRPTYDAEMIVAPASDNSLGAGLSASLGQLSSLASVAGLRLPDSENVTPFAKFVELTQSDELADRLEKKYGFLKYFFSSQWDWQKNDWREPSGPVFQIRSALYALIDQPVVTHPTSFDLGKILKDRVSVDVVARSGMRRVSFSYRDPWLAKALLKAIYDETDAILKDDAQNRSVRQIAFLKDRLRTVTVAEERVALANLLLQQEQQAMLTQSGLAYSAHLIERPTVSERPSSPKPLQVILLFLLFGLAAGAAVAIVRAAFFAPSQPFAAGLKFRLGPTAAKS
jgi:hypothetical protein